MPSASCDLAERKAVRTERHTEHQSLVYHVGLKEGDPELKPPINGIANHIAGLPIIEIQRAVIVRCRDEPAHVTPKEDDPKRMRTRFMIRVLMMYVMWGDPTGSTS